MSVKRYNWDRPAPAQVHVLYALKNGRSYLSKWKLQCWPGGL